MQQSYGRAGTNADKQVCRQCIRLASTQEQYSSDDGEAQPPHAFLAQGSAHSRVDADASYNPTEGYGVKQWWEHVYIANMYRVIHATRHAI